MAITLINNIGEAVYLMSKDKNDLEQKELSRKIVVFLAKKRLLSQAPRILSVLKKIINKEESRIDARVFCVEKVDQATHLKLQNFLKDRYKVKHVEIEEVLNKNILGGLRIEVNDEVIDMSVKNKINKLKEHLTR